MQNTNVNGKHKVPFALRVIKGIGRRFAILACKIAQIDLNRRAGELTEDEMNKISDIIAKPLGKYYAPIFKLCRVSNGRLFSQNTASPSGSSTDRGASRTEPIAI